MSLFNYPSSIDVFVCKRQCPIVIIDQTAEHTDPITDILVIEMKQVESQLTGLPPFLERNMKKQTDLAIFKDF